VEDKITPENCSEKLKLIRENASISRGELAKILGVPESTILRIEDKKKKNIPRNDFLNRLRAIQILGYAKYNDLSPLENKYSADLMTGKLLTVRGVTCGLYFLGSVGFTDINITLNNIPVGQPGYGIIKSLDIICKKNQLIGHFKNGQLEISKKEGNEQYSSSSFAAATAAATATAVLQYPSDNLKKWCIEIKKLIDWYGHHKGFSQSDTSEVIKLLDKKQQQAQLCSGLFWSVWIDQVLFRVLSQDKQYPRFRKFYPFPRLYTSNTTKEYESPVWLIDAERSYKVPGRKLLLEDKNDFWGEVASFLKIVMGKEVVDAATGIFREDLRERFPQELQYLFDEEQK